MISRRMTAACAALILGATTAAACGDDPNDSNPGNQQPEGGKVVTETGPTTLGSTGTQPTVTQGEGGEEE